MALEWIRDRAFVGGELKYSDMRSKVIAMTIKQPEVQSKKYHHLISDIEQGYLKVPKFQRDFVWQADQAASLIDSVLKGYPIGTFILWKTREELRHYKEIGQAKLREVPKGDVVTYVLDGQQRITALFATRMGLSVDREGKKIDFGSIFIDLSLNPQTSDSLTTTEGDGGNLISVKDLLNESIADFAGSYPKGDLDKIDLYRSRLTGYDFSTVVISDHPIDVAVDVFTRINTAGTELTLFEIMVAKTYDETRHFDLAERYNLLVDGDGFKAKCLRDAGFETIRDTTVLQCIAVYLSKEARRENILKLEKTKFIDSWDDVVDGIFSAVDYISTKFRIPVSGLLPYDALFVPFTYFFTRSRGSRPSALQDKLLSQYFWRAALSGRFTSATETKLGADIKRMDLILNGETPDYSDYDPIEIDVDSLKQTYFSAGESFSKAILCLYAYFEPKSFRNDSKVKLDNSWLKISTSKNFHHFFPKAFLKTQTLPGGKHWEDWEMNVVPNITLVDDYLNKRDIGAKPPSKYISTFAKTNPRLDSTLESHLIGDRGEFGILDDDYEKFLTKRSERISAELNARINTL